MLFSYQVFVLQVTISSLTSCEVVPPACNILQLSNDFSIYVYVLRLMVGKIMSYLIIVLCDLKCLEIQILPDRSGELSCLSPVLTLTLFTSLDRKSANSTLYQY